MTGLEIAMIVSALGGMAGGMMGGDGQEMKSFDNSEYNAPRMMGKASGHLDEVMKMLMGRAAQPVDLSDAHVQAPPSFAGGGLPMPFGVSGRDRAGGGPVGAAVGPSTEPRVHPGANGPSGRTGGPGKPNVRLRGGPAGGRQGMSDTPHQPGGMFEPKQWGGAYSRPKSLDEILEGINGFVTPVSPYSGGKGGR